jgi:hypothetical protein
MLTSPESKCHWRWIFWWHPTYIAIRFSAVSSRGGSAADCDGLENLPRVRRIGNAIRPARGLYDRADDKPQARASGVAVWIEIQSRDSLNGLKQLFPLRHRKAAYQPREGR